MSSALYRRLVSAYVDFFSHVSATILLFVSAAIGPYSQAVRAGGFCFISGMIGLDPSTQKMVDGGVAEQATQALANLGGVLTECGIGPKQVVKTTVLLTTMEDYKAVNEVYAEFFKDCEGSYPARAAFAVKGLPANALVEIESIALDTAS